MGRPKVSVIIPAYNRADTIGAAINSVLRQTEPNFELLVVDDASTDRTKDVVREFRDTRVELIEHVQNAGSSVARNTGIRAARGRYIALLDSDDLWFPRMLESQLARLQAAPKQVGGIVADHVYTDAERHPRFVRRNSSSSRSPDELIVIGLQCQRDPLRLERLLHAAHIQWIERQDIVGEHPLKQPDLSVAVAQNEPVLAFVASDLGEPQFFVECS